MGLQTCWWAAHCPVAGCTPMHIWATVTGLRVLKIIKEVLKLGRKWVKSTRGTWRKVGMDE